MNTRIHSFKVYRIETTLGTRYWSFFPASYKNGSTRFPALCKELESCTLWDLLYKVEAKEKIANGRALVKKSDLEFLFREISATDTSPKIFDLNK